MKKLANKSKNGVVKVSNWNKTRIYLIILSVVVLSVGFIIQFNGQKNLTQMCSYFDPWFIDAWAFIAAGFLVVEGLYRIFKHKQVSWKRQLTRMIRVAFGLVVIMIHIMQAMHKFDVF